MSSFTTPEAEEGSDHRPSPKDKSFLHSRIREKTVEKLIQSSQSKRRAFVNKFRENPLNRISLIHELMHDFDPDGGGEEIENPLMNYFQDKEDDLMNSADFYDFYIELERVIEDEISSLEFVNSTDEELENEYIQSLEENAEDQIICPVCRCLLIVEMLNHRLTSFSLGVIV